MQDPVTQQWIKQFDECIAKFVQNLTQFKQKILELINQNPNSVKDDQKRSQLDLYQNLIQTKLMDSMRDLSIQFDMHTKLQQLLIGIQQEEKNQPPQIKEPKIKQVPQIIQMDHGKFEPKDETKDNKDESSLSTMEKGKLVKLWKNDFEQVEMEIPKECQMEFKQAGIKKKDLKNKEISKIVYTTVQRYLMDEQRQKIFG